MRMRMRCDGRNWTRRRTRSLRRIFTAFYRVCGAFYRYGCDAMRRQKLDLATHEEFVAHFTDMEHFY